jgi:hypothetical protein
MKIVVQPCPFSLRFLLGYLAFLGVSAVFGGFVLVFDSHSQVRRISRQ